MSHGYLLSSASIQYSSRPVCHVGLQVAERPELRLRDPKTDAVMAKISLTAPSGRVDVPGPEGKAGASLLAKGDSGGEVVTYAQSGLPMAGIMEHEEGGKPQLAGSGGGTASEASVTANGGQIEVFPSSGGSALGRLGSDGTTGSVRLYNSSTRPVASQVSGQGNSCRAEPYVVRADPILGGLHHDYTWATA